jgi:phage tail sheath protein FI
MTQKTPGVIVEERSILPPSVAEVETAVPAFLGYTEKAEYNGESLFLKPTSIASFKEYELLFGGAPVAQYQAFLDDARRVVAARSTRPFLLYDSLRLFFENGGGRCYIIALKTYPLPTAVSSDDFKAGLEALKEKDEPTLIVAPDAVLLDTGLYDFQKSALSQCEALGDRFLICDLRRSTDKRDFLDKVSEFRNAIGINALKYGAAYGPYLKATFPRKITLRELQLFAGPPSEPPPSEIAVESMTSDNSLLQLIFDLKNAIAAWNALKALEQTVAGTSPTLRARFQVLVSAHQASPTPATLAPVYALIASFFTAMQTFQGALPVVLPSNPPDAPAEMSNTYNFTLRNEVASLADTTGLLDAFDVLDSHAAAYNASVAGASLLTAARATIFAVLGVTPAPTAEELEPDPYGAATDPERHALALQAVTSFFGQLTAYYSVLLSAAAAFESTFEQSLEAAMGLYKQIKAQVGALLSVLPPSGAIAGVYARVDGLRGVWKAPANVSLNAVSEPTVLITAEDQESLNVDPVAGKSINAIRVFTGRGTLVWGARTLAGNDNEWRYINVRRFFNMVEESCKKATESFVFEPNDANTWVRVQAMIENFLTLQWRAGALQGATPEDAFYVAVGLGKTMTALDILEGRMIVEIGMAVVRPAEFIILRFTHKLAES